MVKTITSFIISLALLLTGVPLLADDLNSIEIRILPESIVYGDYYSLGDIAELDGFDIETIQKLARLQIGKSPLPGRSFLVSHGNVRRKVKSLDTDRDFNIILPSKPMVSRASIKIEQDQLNQLIINEIRSHYQQYEKVEVSIKSTFKDVYLPKGVATYEIERVGKAIQIGGNSTWSIRLLVDGVERKKMYVRAKIEVFDDVFVAKDGIGRGEKIEKADLTAITKDISRKRVGYQSKPKLIVGKQAKRPIYKNESVENSLVEKPVLVKKGAPVKLIYKTKNLLLTNIVKALKEGKKGDIIPVRPLSGERTIYAVVIDENSVEVAL